MNKNRIGGFLKRNMDAVGVALLMLAIFFYIMLVIGEKSDLLWHAKAALNMCRDHHMFANNFFPKRLIVGISVKGPLHVKEKIPNQDSFLCFKSFGFTLLVISDGLGSKKYSDFGSKMVCLAVKNICKQDFKLIKNIKRFDWDNFLSRAYLEWKRLIEKTL